MIELENVINNTQIFYFCKIDLEGNYTYVSPHFEAVFELKSEDVMGTSSLDTIYIEDHQKTFDIIKICFENPKTYQRIELRKPLKNGNIKWTQWEFYLDTNEDNQPTEIICYGFDLTERVKAIDLLQQTKLELDDDFVKFQTLFETPSLAIILHNQNGDIFEANQYFCDLVGIKKEEISNYNLEKFIPQKNWARTKLLIDQLIKTGNSITYEKEFINKNGDLIPISANKRVFYNSQGTPFIWCLAIDILEKEKQKELLQKQKELLEQTAQIAKLGGWELDLKFSKTEWTNQVYEIFEVGLDFSNDLSKALQFYVAEDKEILTTALNLAITDGNKFDLALRIVTANNKNKWVRVIGQPIFKSEKIIAIKGTVQDITERKKSEQTISKQNDLLKDFSFTQSHLIRLPIANILGLSDLLKLNNTEKEKDEIYNKIIKSIELLDQTLKDVANKKITD